MFAYQQTLDTLDLLSEIDEELMLKYYFNITDINKNIISPFRNDDTHPSFKFYFKENCIHFIDFGTNLSGNIFQFLSYLWKVNYSQVLNIVNKDKHNFLKKSNISKTTINNISGNTIHNSNIKNYKPNIRKSIIKPTFSIKERSFKETDKKYWLSYGIDTYWLNFANIKSISTIIITKQEKTKVINCENYAYAYIIPEKNNCENNQNSLYVDKIKIYQPFSTQIKWLSNVKNTTWNLINKLPENGDKLIITSSMKDSLTLWQSLNIPSISLQSEMTLPLSIDILYLKQKFKHIYILYDNDYMKPINTGLQRSTLISKKYNLENVQIPSKYNCKDPSDLYYRYNKQQYLEIMKRLLNL